MAMHSIYIGQLVWPAAAPLIVRMCVRLVGVAIVYYYLHPAILQSEVYHNVQPSTLHEITYS